MATELAQAYVQIVPSAEGIKGKIGEALGDEPQKAGEKAGEESGRSFGASMAKGIAAAAAAITTAAVGLVKGVIDGAKETAAFGDVIDKTSQKLGMSASAFQEWDYVMNLAGTNMQNMSAGLKTLTNKLDDAANGSESAQEMFAALGISLEDISTMSREDLFAATIKGFQGMADTTERAALANELFGRSGQELTPLFNQSAEATQEQIDRAREYGMVMSDELVKDSAAFVDAQTTLSNTLGGLKNRLMGEFLPSLTAVTEGLAAFLAGDSTGLQTMQDGITQFIDSLSQNLPKVMEFATGIIQALADGFLQNLPMLFSTVAQLVEQIAQSLPEILPELIPPIIQGLVDIGIALIKNLPIILLAIGEAILQIAMTLGELLAGLWSEHIAPWLSDVFSGIGEWFSGIWSSIGQWFSNIIQKVVTFFTNIWQKYNQTRSNVINGVKNFFSNIWSSIVSWFSKIIQKVVSFVTSIPQKIRDGFSKVTQAGLDLVKGLWNGIKNATQWVLDKIKGFGQSILNGIKRIFGIGSPSKEMAYFGEMLDAGLAQGIEGNTRPITNAIDDITTMTTKGFSGNIGVTSSYDGNTTTTGMSQLISLVAALAEKVDNLQVYLDGDLLVGGISDRMDTALGTANVRKARGLA